MDFVILKVNGRDVTNSSHEDTVRIFKSAHEPITIQVLRMKVPQCKNDTLTPSSKTPTQEQVMPTKNSNLVSTAVQTDLGGFINDDYFDNYYVYEDGVEYDDEEDEDDDDDDVDDGELIKLNEILSNPNNDGHQIENYKLGNDVLLEEVTLCKSTSMEKLGLTVSYNYAPDRGNSEAAEIYISEITPDSLAARDGRLREGDQILRVNGQDIENKEQTERIFAQTKNKVTILVSRCLSQHSSPTSPITSPAYQNTMIELLMRQQQRQQRQIESQDNESLPDPSDPNIWLQRALTPPPIPSHNTITTVTTSSSSITPSSTCSSQNSHNSNKDVTKLQSIHFTDWKSNVITNINDATKKMEELSIRNKLVSTTTITTATVIDAVSDTEHIYETIPESDCEPIYSSPYESRSHVNRITPESVNQHINRNKSSKSSSSVEEKDSSSAYNTGESCKSNPLVLELHRGDRDHRGSTLVLCPPENTAGMTPNSCKSKPFDGMTCSQTHPSLVGQANNYQLTSQDDKKASSVHHYQHHRHGYQYHHPQQYYYHHHHYYHHPLNSNQNSQIENREYPTSINNTNTMYTNIDNLERTMNTQKQAFSQAVNKKNVTNKETKKNSKSREKFRAPNLTQYHFIGSQQVRNTSTILNTPEDNCDPRTEWKVKRRPDGTRYIARRTVRNRLLGNRTLEISEERAGQTTEDDTVSEIKLGRYWSKDERKRHIEHARQRKLRHQSMQHQLQQQQQQQLKSSSRPCRDLINCDPAEEETKETVLTKKSFQDNNVSSHMNRIDDVNNCGTNGKPLGLLSVTTV